MKRLVMVVAVVVVAALSGGDAAACVNGPCAEQFEFCWETAQEIEGEWRDCCTGFCLGPLGSGGCNNDSNQCRCYDIGSPR